MNGLAVYGNSDDEEGGRSSSSTRKAYRMHNVEPKIKTKLSASTWSSKSSSSTSWRAHSYTQPPGSVHLERAMPSLNLESRSRSLQGKAENSAPEISRGSSEAPSARRGERHPLYDNEDEGRLRPPPIPGSNDGEYDIPPRPEAPCDPELDAKVMKFYLLKRQGKHFNDTLMQNKAFRNPHIYAKLVDFVSVEETATNFPKDLWDPFDVREEWYAEAIAAEQKARSEKLSAAQAPGARTRIAFESSSTSNSKGKEREKDSRRSHHSYDNRNEERTRDRDRDRPRDRERRRGEREEKSSHPRYHSERR